MATPPTFTQYAEVANWQVNGTPARTVSGVSWSAGDDIYVIGGTADAACTFTGVPTASGLTFSQIAAVIGTPGSSPTAYLWVAHAASAGGPVTVSSSTTSNGSPTAGISVLVVSGSDGAGTPVGAFSGTARSVSLTRVAANSGVLFINFDWTAENPAPTAWTPGSQTQRTATSDGANYGIEIATWGDQGAAGTTSYGQTGTASNDTWAKIAVEIKGSAAQIPMAAPRFLGGPMRSTPMAAPLLQAPQWQDSTTSGIVDYTASPNDPVGVTDAATAVQDLVRNASDPVGITDTASAAQDFVRAPADPVGVTDAVTLDRSIAPADPVGVTDARSIVQDNVRSANDPVGISDAAASVQDLQRAPADPVGITDAVTAVLSKDAFPADPVGITDAASRVQDLVRAAADPVGVTDAASAVQDAQRTPADPVGITDQAAIEQGRLRADPVGITDVVVTVQDVVRTSNDPVGITDSAATVQDLARSPADPVGITDSVTWVMTIVRTVNDPVGITDSATSDLQSSGNFTKNVDDPVGITDQASAQQAIDRALSDPVGITDATALQRDLTRNDPVGITDASSMDRGTSPADPVGLTDSVSWVMTMVRTVNDPVGVTDQAALDRAVTVNDPVGITDAASRVIDFVRNVVDQLGITDTSSQVRVVFATIDDLVGITDQGTPTGAVVEPPPAPFVGTPETRPTRVRVLLDTVNTRLRDDTTYAADVQVVLDQPLVALEGDVGYASHVQAVISDDPAGQAAILLEDDEIPEDPIMSGDLLLISFTIRARTRTGYDVEGNATFQWNDVITDDALKWETRQEFDSIAGATVTVGILLIRNSTDAPITESAVAVDNSSGEMWRIRQVIDLPESTKLVMERIDA